MMSITSISKTGKVYAYCRVSTKEQNLDRQIIAMKELGIPDNCIYSDKMSGKNFDRKYWNRLYRKLREGDVLVIKSIDRLGRDYEGIGNMWKRLVFNKKVIIKVLDMPILTMTDNNLMNRLLSDIILQLLAYVAQTERDNLLQRQAEGIEAAKRRGVQFGRPKVKAPEDFGTIVHEWWNKTISMTEAVTRSGLAQRTFYRKAHLYMDTHEDEFKEVR